MSRTEPTRNKILQRLPAVDLERVLALGERVTPPLGEIMAQAGMAPKWVHFPESGVLSSMVVLENGSTVEGSTVGNEWMDGVYLLAEKLANPYKINVQVEGEFLRLPATAFKQVLEG